VTTQLPPMPADTSPMLPSPKDSAFDLLAAAAWFLAAGRDEKASELVELAAELLSAPPSSA